MKLAIAAIGKPGRGPEAALADDLARRATLSGRPLGLGPLELIDLEPKKPGTSNPPTQPITPGSARVYQRPAPSAKVIAGTDAASTRFRRCSCSYISSSFTLPPLRDPLAAATPPPMPTSRS